MTRRESLIADQRGAVSFEMLFVFSVLMLSLFLPLADIAIAGFQFISAWQALHAFGQSILYSPPPDPTNASSWASTAKAKADSRYPIPSIQIICGDNKTDCSDATLFPKYYVYTTTVTLAPLLLPLCGNAKSCSFPLSYSERFQ
jgi:hypothetical protein